MCSILLTGLLLPAGPSPYDCFPQGLYNMHVTYALCICTVIKEVASFQGAWSINGCGT